MEYLFDLTTSYYLDQTGKLQLYIGRQEGIRLGQIGSPTARSKWSHKGLQDVIHWLDGLCACLPLLCMCIEACIRLWILGRRCRGFSRNPRRSCDNSPVRMAVSASILRDGVCLIHCDTVAPIATGGFHLQRGISQWDCSLPDLCHGGPSHPSANASPHPTPGKEGSSCQPIHRCRFGNSI